jgi:hypothetical protein
MLTIPPDEGSSIHVIARCDGLSCPLLVFLSSFYFADAPAPV